MNGHIGNLIQIIKRLEEVKYYLKSKKTKDQTQNEYPKGLGKGLPYPAKQPGRDSANIPTSNQDEFQIKDSTIIHKEDTGESVVGVTNGQKTRDLDIYNRKIEEYPKVNEEFASTELMEQQTEEITDDKMEDKSSISEEDDKLSTSAQNQTSKIEEPKYRFQNRRRHGSMFTISRSDYQLMTKRKSLKYYDAKSGAFMEVRLANQYDEDLTDSCEDHKQPQVCSNKGGKQPSPHKEMSENEGSLEMHSEIHSCVTPYSH